MRFAVCFAVLAGCRVWAQDLSGAPDGATLPMIVEVPLPPIAVRADGGYKFAYEVHMTNWSSREIFLTSSEVSPAQEEGTGFTLAGESLVQATISSDSKEKNNLHIGPGMRAAVFLFLSTKELPLQFYHCIRFHSAGKEEELLTAPVCIRENRLRIEPPLRGERWVALNGPDSNTHHRRSIMPYAGRLVVPQRWAIDFLQVDEKGTTHSGDSKSNKNYRCYGAKVLAVSSATVLSVKDGIPDNVPDASARAVPMTWESVSGNHVVLDLGIGRYVFYAHLQPGSIRVKKGDRVTGGQVIGLLGNSGNSTEPHLHFQVSDDRELLGGDGVPFAITSFMRGGVEHNREIPLRDWVVDFR